MKQITVLGILSMISFPVFAAGDVSSTSNGLPIVIYIFAFILLLIGLIILKIAVHLKKYADKELGDDAVKEKSFLESILKLKSIDSDKDTIINHGHDGIYELDNPPPPWFMFLFYATIVFAAVYFVRFIVLDSAYTQEDEYRIEVAELKESIAANNAANPKAVEVETIELRLDEATLAAGKVIYGEKCIACHGEFGEGVVGPAFVDDNWIHDCDILGVFKSIKYGYMSKGMQAWKGTLSPKDLRTVSNYVYSLRGKKLPAGKVVKPPKTGDNPCTPEPKKESEPEETSET